jgi:hypothetical protein
VTSFWFLLGIFSQISEATFSGGIEGIRRTGSETKVTLQCERKKRVKKLET